MFFYLGVYLMVLMSCVCISTVCNISIFIIFVIYSIVSARLFKLLY